MYGIIVANISLTILMDRAGHAFFCVHVIDLLHSTRLSNSLQYISDKKDKSASIISMFCRQKWYIACGFGGGRVICQVPGKGLLSGKHLGK